MKSFVAATILLAALVCTAFFTSHALTEAADELAGQAERLREANAAEREHASERIEALWKEKRFAFSMAINHSELDPLEGALARLKGAANAEDGDDYLIAAAELAASLAHIRELCAVSLDNIL